MNDKELNSRESLAKQINNAYEEFQHDSFVRRDKANEQPKRRNECPSCSGDGDGTACDLSAV
jgi:hypothetical protein